MGPLTSARRQARASRRSGSRCRCLTRVRRGLELVGGDPEPVSNIEIYVGLKPAAQWTTAQTRSEMQERMEMAALIFPVGLIVILRAILIVVDIACRIVVELIERALVGQALANPSGICGSRSRWGT